MRRLSKYAAILVLIAYSHWAVAEEEAQAPDESVTRLIGLLQGINNLATPISQTVVSSDGDVLQQVKGSLTVARPGKFRIVTEDPLPQVLVSDGSKLWNYDPDLEQLIISRLNQDIGEVPILILSGDEDQISRQFNVEHFETEDTVEFVLIPLEQTSLFSRIRLSFVAAVPQKITIIDGFQQQTDISFDQVEMNQPLQADVFSFTAPEGADVVDDT